MNILVESNHGHLRTRSSVCKNSGCRVGHDLRFPPHTSVFNFSESSNLTNRELLSNITKVFDVLGWLSPTIIFIKILYGRSEYNGMNQFLTYIYPEKSGDRSCTSLLLYEDHKHLGLRFCDVSEAAYAGVVYLRMLSAMDEIQMSLVSKFLR